jgi:hypothetical protein
MRLTFVVAASIVVLTIAMWGLTLAPHPKDVNAASTSASIDVTHMMNDARNLPVERFDTH